MAAKKDEYIPPVPWNTIIDVFKIKGDRIAKKSMTFAEWHKMKKQPGWQYLPFEKGFSSLKPTE